MKNRKLLGLTLSLALIASLAQGQSKTLNREPNTNKPKLFTQLPDRIPVAVADLENLIRNNQETGKDVNADVASKGSGTFSGKIVSTASKYGNSIRSIVIRSTKFKGATFSLSAVMQADSTVKYTGRIISFEHGDLYELQPDGEHYALVKKNYYELVNE